MITTDTELKATQERIAYFQSLMAQLRVSTSREEFPLVAGSYQAEIERMQAEAMEYLTHHVDEVAASTTTK